MGKRKRDSRSFHAYKKNKSGGFIDPNTSGIYATCNRGKESQCRNELMNLFSEKFEQYYDIDEKDWSSEDDEEGDSIEAKIAKEVNDIQEKKNSKKEYFKPIDLNCECLVFIKTRKPVEPEKFVESICAESSSRKSKSTRYTQRLTPITFSVSANLDEVRKLALKVLEPHFHANEDQKPYKFAISLSKRNFNVIQKMDIIKTIAECVGREHGHKVDLKLYDKLILVECYKNNIGMSVVNNYDSLQKFNLQQIFEESEVHNIEASLSRVSKTDD
ncbi:uncharacterized protein PRCAT00000610001 [Priceomyces carsonii]|uniref:uncharacterized protein n=1 Tax=Priceomyces carsonii TaxID=28549 RepID=UPI002EDB4B81|nr:unnamed protein product [Priceomyces carsonii]